MIPIVFSTDHNYVMPTGVTIASLLLSSGGETYDIYVMASEDVDTTDRRRLQDQVKRLSPSSTLSFVDMSRKYEGAHETRGISKATYYRLMIPWLIPDVDKIIYADVDIIFKTSLRTLFETPLDGKLLAGALTSPPEHWAKFKKYFERIGADYTHYINAGILLMNSRLLREEGLDSRFDDLSRKKFLYQDQDILNVSCRDRIAYFDKRYNLQPRLYGSEEKYSTDVAIHYAGEKPWDTFTYAWVQWWEVYEKSDFYDSEYYREVSARILSLSGQAKTLAKKITIQLQLMKKRLF